MEVKCNVCGTGRLTQDGANLLCTVCPDEMVAVLVQIPIEFPAGGADQVVPKLVPDWWPECQDCNTKMRPAGDYYVCEGCGRATKLNT